ncbi:MAG: M48 family metallopeptidase [Burkholderiales bacterium]|jgi:predicted metal-dependent hydrolase
MNQQLNLFDDTPEVSQVKPGLPTARRRSLQLGTVVLNYELKRARRRTIGLSISDGGLVIAAPRWVGIAEIESVIREKSRWVLNKLTEWQERKHRLPQVCWQDGGKLPYLGGELILRLDPTVSEADCRDSCLVLPLAADASTEQIRDRAQAWLQQQAQQRFAERMALYCARAEVAVGRWRLSTARTRWGSCSADGTIRLNWRLIHMSADVVDYVIAHEIAHRKELNHGPDFWRVVESLFPEFRAAEALLKRHPLMDLGK